MSETTDPRIRSELDPASSRALFLAVEKRRRTRGMTRAKLAQVSGGGMSANALDMLASRVSRGARARVELGNALALLAAVGIASNRVDSLVAELADGVASLIEEAAS